MSLARAVCIGSVDERVRGRRARFEIELESGEVVTGSSDIRDGTTSGDRGTHVYTPYTVRG